MLLVTQFSFSQGELSQTYPPRKLCFHEVSHASKYYGKKSFVSANLKTACDFYVVG